MPWEVSKSLAWSDHPPPPSRWLITCRTPSSWSSPGHEHFRAMPLPTPTERVLTLKSFLYPTPGPKHHALNEAPPHGHLYSES